MKLLKVKWENITLMIFGTFFIYCIVSHIIKNGFDMNMLMFEILLYGLVLGINYFAISNTRKLFLQNK